MSRRALVGLTVTVAIASAAGYAFGARSHDSRNAQSRDTLATRSALTELAPSTSNSATQQVSVRDDGTVSIHIDRVPLVWLMDELNRKGARLPLAGKVAKKNVASSMALAGDQQDKEEPDAVEQARLADALREGTDDDRFAALTRASQVGIDLPADLLRQAYETDPSERLRLLAFTTYLDAVSGNIESVREALNSGTINQSAVVRAEAHKRIQELEQYEMALAATPPQGMP
jgi:hypothetical protein